MRGLLRRSQIVLLFIAVTASLNSARAQGGPPMVTDDPETPGSGKWEINVAGTLAQRPGERAWEVPSLDINYGVGEHIQLKLEGAFALLQSRNRDLAAGLGEALAGVKWRFLDEERAGVSMSTYPQVEWNLAHASVRRGLVEDGTHLLLPIEISRKFGFVVLDAEIGNSLGFGAPNEWFYGLLAAVQATRNLELLLELHGESEFDRSGDQLAVNLGARRKLSEDISLLFSIGHDVRATEGEARRLESYLGVQFNF